MIQNIIQNPNKSFMGDDTFSEHIESANFKSIKEILEPPMKLVAMSGNYRGMVEMLESMKSNNVWVLHCIRVLYKQMVIRLDEKHFVPLVQERLNCATYLAAQILKLEQEVPVNGNVEMVLRVKHAITKCMLTLSKTLMSQRIKQVVQEKIAEEVAALLGYENRHEILKNLIKFCLLQVEFLKQAYQKENHIFSMIFEETLKFLVYLTITKPYMNKAERCMQIKSFVLEFDTLI